jgi:Na+-transporting NADH:ubiquinone oxidoreductase subunit NqrC
MVMVVQVVEDIMVAVLEDTLNSTQWQAVEVDQDTQILLIVMM